MSKTIAAVIGWLCLVLVIVGVDIAICLLPLWLWMENVDLWELGFIGTGLMVCGNFGIIDVNVSRSY